MKKSILKSKLAHQLTGAAFTLAAIALFSFISPKENNILSPFGEEPGGGKTITSATGKEYIANFPKWKASSGQKGGYLSKTALYTLFDANPAASGIFWYMGTDVNGSTFNLIIEPGTSVHNGIDTTVKSLIFMSESMCPTDCGGLAN